MEDLCRGWVLVVPGPWRALSVRVGIKRDRQTDRQREKARAGVHRDMSLGPKTDSTFR